MDISTRPRAGIIGGVVLAALVVGLTLLASRPPAGGAGSPGPSSSGTTAAASLRRTPSPTSVGRATPPPPAQLAWHTTDARTQLSGMALTPRGIIAVGWDARGAVLWRSSDGQDWAVDDDSVVFDGARLVGAAANTDRTVVVGCIADPRTCVTPAAWARGSADAASWERAHGAPLGAVEPTTVVASSGGFLAAGSDGDGHWHVATSPDGLSWAAGTSPASGNDVLIRFVALGDRFGAVGKRVTGKNADGNAVGPAELWTSTDGRSWTAADLVDDATAFAAAVLPGGSTMVVGGSDEGTVGYAWTSSDRQTWTERTVPGTTTECQSGLDGLVVGPDGTLVTGGCGAFLLTPGQNPVRVGDPPLGPVVDGPRGYVGVGSDAHSIETSYFDVANPPLDPLADFGNGQGWTSPTSLPVPNPMTAVVDPASRLFVFSLTGTLGTLRVDRFDPATSHWSRLPDIAAGLGWAKAVVERSGKVLLVGVSLSGHAARALEYDPKAQTWQWRASPKVARTGFGLAELDGSTYAVGGQVSPCCDGVAGDGALDVVERFDEVHDTWSTVSHLPVPDLTPGAIGSQVPVPPDPTATPAPTPSDGSEAPTPMKSVLLVFLSARVWQYDPATRAWTPGPASLSSGVTGSPVLGVDGIVRVFTCTRYDLYDPQMGHWQPGQAFDVNRCGAIAVSDGANIYVFGGVYLPEPGRSVSAFFAGGG